MGSISDRSFELLCAICENLEKLPEHFRAGDVARAKCAGYKGKKETALAMEELCANGLLKQEEFSWGSYKYSIPQEVMDFVNNPDNRDAFTEEDLSEDYRSELEKEVKKYKKFVIVTAVVDKPVNQDFLASIKNYAKRNNALMMVLPSDIHNKKDGVKISLDPSLRDFRVVYKDLYLNNNLCVCSIKTSAKQIKTLTGLERIATKKGASIIVASTKLFEENVPTQKGKIPLRIVTTGAVTKNNYDTDRYMSKRTAYIASEDHMYGAAVVELVDNERFHLRLVEGSANDSFTDLGIEYKPDGSIVYLNNSCYVMGDSHTEMLNKKLHKCMLKVLDDMRVGTVVLHDIFNATSITHHDKGKNLTRAMKAINERSSLVKEGEGLKGYLDDLRKHVRNLVIVNSNHDRHLESYLEEGRYISDPINTYTAHKLAIAYMEEKNPLQCLLQMLGLDSNGIKWLKQDESYRVYGVECGAHGDAGCNGGRGNISSFEKALGNCVTAHTHTAKRLRGACCVGVVGELDQGYNKGLTTWSHTICLVYPNGTKQLVHFIPDKNGNYIYSN